MNSTRVMKDVRQLAWPWAMVTLAGLLSLTRPQLKGDLGRDVFEFAIMIGAFLGIPLLAILPIGAEFQHRTFTLALAQPVARETIWRQKLILSFAAVLLPALLYLAGLRSRPNMDQIGWLWLFVVAVASASGAIFWTLVARSTIGGLALNYCVPGLIQVSWMYIADRLGVLNAQDQVSRTYFWGTGGMVLAYSATVIWLGRRKLLTYQATEGMQAGETVIPGAQLIPGFITDIFRSRPRGAILNLVRREFHLLRVVWALCLLSTVAVLSVLALHVPKHQTAAETVAIALAGILCGLIAMLSGTLSLGEEKNWGTHEWHMTVPVATSTQWLVKLLTALFTGVVAGALVPMSVLLIAGWVKGGPLMYLGQPLPWLWPLEMTLVALIGFWCACATKGTVRAALWIIPLCLALGFSARLGIWAFGAFGWAGKALEALIWRLDPVAVSGAVARSFDFRDLTQTVLAVVAAPCVTVALIQSHRLFRTQTEDRKIQMLHTVLPLMTTTLIWALVINGAAEFANRAWQDRYHLVMEVHTAIEKLRQEPATSLEPMRLSVVDLEKTLPLSDRTRHWLAGASLTVTPDKYTEANGPRYAGIVDNEFSLYVPGAIGTKPVPYSLLIRKADGKRCYVRFSPRGNGGFGILDGTCES
jgi:hypothetical protein